MNPTPAAAPLGQIIHPNPIEIQPPAAPNVGSSSRRSHRANDTPKDNFDLRFELKKIKKPLEEVDPLQTWPKMPVSLLIFKWPLF